MQIKQTLSFGLLFAFSQFLGLQVLAQTTLTLGIQNQFTSVSSGLDQFPAPFGKDGAFSVRQQFIYDQASLHNLSADLFQIEKIAFYIDSIRDSTLDELSIAYSGIVQADSILNAFHNDQLIAGGTFQNYSLKPGWNEFSLDTTHGNWIQKGKNVLLDVCFKDSSKTQNTLAFHTGNQIALAYTDSNQTACNVQLLSFTDRDRRPDIKLTLRTVKHPTSIPKLSLNSINVYPNPVQNTLNVRVETSVDFELIDLSGKSIRIGQFNSGTEMLNLEELLPGYYFLRLIQDEQVSTIKLVKQ